MKKSSSVAAMIFLVQLVSIGVIEAGTHIPVGQTIRNSPYEPSPTAFAKNVTLRTPAWCIMRLLLTG